MVFARKRFGQHFLHDRSVLQRSVSAGAPAPGDALVEIGPGHGALTDLLVGKARSLDTIEIDRDLAGELKDRLGSTPGFALHVADALDFDFAALSAERGSQRLRVIGNLPYNISTPLLFHLASMHEHIDDLHVMLQKEVIDRIAAAPGSSEYGRLTVMLAPWFETKHLFDVGPGAFAPPPKVWSAVARLTVRRTPAFEIPPAFARTVSSAFSHRRKTLRNALRGVAEPSVILDAIVAAGVDPGARPETVSPAQFAAIAQRVGDLVPEASATS
jgi:16S rRNA (adenine1518-N6/adenine1519-N6)-dimethyltransferase